MPLPRWVEPQLAKLVEKAPAGPNWDQCARLRSKAERERRTNTDRSGRKMRTRKIDPFLPFPSCGVGQDKIQSDPLSPFITEELRARRSWRH